MQKGHDLVGIKGLSCLWVAIITHSLNMGFHLISDTLFPPHQFMQSGNSSIFAGIRHRYHLYPDDGIRSYYILPIPARELLSDGKVHVPESG